MRQNRETLMQTSKIFIAQEQTLPYKAEKNSNATMESL
jgi:hypothetical protein